METTTFCTSTDDSAECCSNLTDWSALPIEVLTLVLQHTSQQHRLSSCALTCSRWATAAASATKAVKLSHAGVPCHDRTPRIESLQAWLANQAQQVESMQVSTADADLLLALPAMPALDLTQLPSTNHLQSLELQQIKLTLPEYPVASLLRPQDVSSSQASAQMHAASLQGFTQLTGLSLASCYIATAATLALPPTLQELALKDGLWGASGSMNSTLMQSTTLCSLTKLELHDDRTGFTLHTALPYATKLSNLESLSLAKRTRRGISWVQEQQLQQQETEQLSSLSTFPKLTELKLSGFYRVAAGQYLAPLTNLQRLELDGCAGLQAAALQALSKLQHLHTVIENMAELLNVLPGLQELTHVSLVASAADQAPAKAYIRLTACSKLACLRMVSAATIEESGFLWDHALRPGSELVRLTQLCVINCAPLPLERLPDACPNLQQLELSVHEAYGRAANALQQKTDQAEGTDGVVEAHPMAALQQLTCLTRLLLQGGNFSSLAEGVRQLTALQDLQIRAWSPLLPQDVLGLTQLQRLTRLECAPLSSEHVCAREYEGARMILLCNQVRCAVCFWMLYGAGSSSTSRFHWDIAMHRLDRCCCVFLTPSSSLCCSCTLCRHALVPQTSASSFSIVWKAVLHA